MYPLVRFAMGVYSARRMPKLDLFDAHVSRHTCLPWDLDPWNELNNGRTLTLYDLGRIPFALRNGVASTLRAQRWGMTVAGSTVRYRRRIRGLEKVTMVTRFLGWDERFLYLDQSLWKGSDCANQVVMRQAVTDAKGIVAPGRMIAAMGHDTSSPALPDWVQAWCAAEAMRPWPPESGAYLRF